MLSLKPHRASVVHEASRASVVHGIPLLQRPSCIHRLWRIRSRSLFFSLLFLSFLFFIQVQFSTSFSRSRVPPSGWRLLQGVSRLPLTGARLPPHDSKSYTYSSLINENNQNNSEQVQTIRDKGMQRVKEKDGRWNVRSLVPVSIRTFPNFSLSFITVDTFQYLISVWTRNWGTRKHFLKKPWKQLKFFSLRLSLSLSFTPIKSLYEQTDIFTAEITQIIKILNAFEEEEDEEAVFSVEVLQTEVRSSVCRMTV